MSLDADLATLRALQAAVEYLLAGRAGRRDELLRLLDDAPGAAGRVEAEIARLREMCAAHTQNEMELVAEGARLREGLRGLLSEAEQHGLWWLENRLRGLLAEDSAA